MSPHGLGDVRDDVALEAGVEQGTSIDGSSNNPCSPCSQARWTPGKAIRQAARKVDVPVDQFSAALRATFCLEFLNHFI